MDTLSHFLSFQISKHICLSSSGPLHKIKSRKHLVLELKLHTPALLALNTNSSQLNTVSLIILPYLVPNDQRFSSNYVVSVAMVVLLNVFYLLNVHYLTYLQIQILDAKLTTHSARLSKKSTL